MPTYSYFCKFCPKCRPFEVFRKLSEYKEKEKCPICGKVCDRDYQQDDVYGSVKLSDNQLTVGHFAERQSKRLSSEEKFEKFKEQNSYRYREPTEDELKVIPTLKKKDPEKEFKKLQKRAEIKARDRAIKKDRQLYKKAMKNDKKRENNT